MDNTSDQPLDPSLSLYIDRLGDADAFHREAAAWSLGELGSPRAARPLAGLLLRELESVEALGFIGNGDVVRATVEAIRRIGAPEALFALVRGLEVLSRARGVGREIVEDIVECIAAVGGFSAVREAADRVVRQARLCAKCGSCHGLRVVAEVTFERLVLCGDPGVATLRRVARTGPDPLQRIAGASLLAV